MVRALTPHVMCFEHTRHPRMLHLRKDYQSRIQDAANKIPDDEPVFLLRATDLAAPAAVESWAHLAAAHGADPELTARVRAWADDMRAWAAEHADGGKIPDAPLDQLLPFNASFLRADLPRRDVSNPIGNTPSRTPARTPGASDPTA